MKRGLDEMSMCERFVIILRLLLALCVCFYSVLFVWTCVQCSTCQSLFSVSRIMADQPLNNEMNCLRWWLSKLKAWLLLFSLSRLILHNILTHTSAQTYHTLQKHTILKVCRHTQGAVDVQGLHAGVPAAGNWPHDHHLSPLNAEWAASLHFQQTGTGLQHAQPHRGVNLTEH